MANGGLAEETAPRLEDEDHDIFNYTQPLLPNSHSVLLPCIEEIHHPIHPNLHQMQLI